MHFKCWKHRNLASLPSLLPIPFCYLLFSYLSFRCGFFFFFANLSKYICMYTYTHMGIFTNFYVIFICKGLQKAILPWFFAFNSIFWTSLIPGHGDFPRYSLQWLSVGAELSTVDHCALFHQCLGPSWFRNVEEFSGFCCCKECHNE